jgi:hypothetical protein
MSTCAQPQGRHTQQNHLEYHIVSTLTQRRTIHPSHGHTQPLGDDSTLQRRTMPQPLGDDSTLTQRRTMPHHVGMPNTGLPLRSTQHSHRGERILEDVSQRCNHQHSLSAREAFSTRPSLSRKSSNFVQASGLVKISAICSCVGRYCTCTAFLCTMSMI